MYATREKAEVLALSPLIMAVRSVFVVMVELKIPKRHKAGWVYSSTL